MAKVCIEDYEIQGIADAIREKSENKEGLLPSEMPQAILDIPTDGSLELPFWYDYFTNVSFANAIFPTGTDIVVDLQRWNGGIVSFNKAVGMKSIKIKTPFSDASMTAANYFTYFNTNTDEDVLETIDLSETTTKFTSLQNFVPWRKKLVTIIGELDVAGSTSMSNAFSGCYELKDIRFAKGSIDRSLSFSYSSKLSTESVKSIINGLANLFELDKDTQKITFHDDVSVTAEQRQDALDNGWVVEGGTTE